MIMDENPQFDGHDVVEVGTKGDGYYCFVEIPLSELQARSLAAEFESLGGVVEIPDDAEPVTLN
jgi:hypothetical protein